MQHYMKHQVRCCPLLFLQSFCTIDVIEPSNYPHICTFWSSFFRIFFLLPNRGRGSIAVENADWTSSPSKRRLNTGLRFTGLLRNRKLWRAFFQEQRFENFLLKHNVSSPFEALQMSKMGSQCLPRWPFELRYQEGHRRSQTPRNSASPWNQNVSANSPSLNLTSLPKEPRWRRWARSCADPT